MITWGATIMRFAFYVAAAFILSLTLCPRSFAGEKIALLISSDEGPYKETVAGFTEYLSKQSVQPTYELFILEGSPAKAAAAVQKIKINGCNLIFSLGSLATDVAVKEFTTIPIVAGLVVRTDAHRKAANLIEVGLEFPTDIQFTWIKNILPEARTIGVVFNPDENKKKIDAAIRIAQKMGLKLETQEVHTAQDVPEALERLARKADVLWGAMDSIVMAPQQAKPVLLFSFRNSIPLMAPSLMWVKAGALFSLDCDYKDLGAQCGELALKALKGVAPVALPRDAPRRVLYSLNLITAQQMKIVIPEALIRGARQTY